MSWTNFSYLHPTTSPYTKAFLLLSKKIYLCQLPPLSNSSETQILALFCSFFLVPNSSTDIAIENFHEITLFKKSKCSKILLVEFR